MTLPLSYLFMDARSLHLPCSASEAVTHLEESAAAWGGKWYPDGEGGRLLLPVNAGLKRGFVVAEVELFAESDAVRVLLRPIETEMRLNVGATGVMVFGALGGLVAMLWPFFPALIQVAPFAAVLAVVAWLLVAGRLRSRGLEDFASLVEASAPWGDDEPEPAS